MWSLQYFGTYIRLGREVAPHKKGDFGHVFKGGGDGVSVNQFFIHC
jgi:hypothetical protein